MTERSVTVHLNAAVTRYLRNMKQAEDQTARVRSELRGLDEEATHLTRAGLVSSLAGLPGLISPLAAGMVALPGLAVTAAASFGALAVALNGTGDAIKAVNEGDPEKLAEAMAQLSTAAREFITEYQRVRPALSFAGDASQDEFFRQLLGDLDKLTSAYLPTMLNQVPRLSGALGKMGHELAGFATAPETVTRVNKQIALATDLTQDWTRFLKAGLGIVLELADAGTGFNRGLVGGLANGAEALQRWVAQRAAMGDLNRLLNNGAQVLSKLGEVAEEAGELVFDALANPALADAAVAFLDFLHMGLQVVHGLVNAFSALPEPLQSTAATLLAVGGAVLLLAGRFAALKGAALAAMTNLRSVGSAGVVAANGLERVGRHAGKAALAFAALQVASIALSSMTDETADVERLTKSLEDLGRTGVRSGELARVFGDDLSGWGRDLERNDMWIAKFGRTVEGIIPGVRQLSELFDNSFTGSAENIKAVDAALTDMVRRGDLDRARAAITYLSQNSGKSFDELSKDLPGFTAAMAEAEKATDGQAQASDRAAKRAEILARGLLGSVHAGMKLIDVFDTLNGRMLAWAEAEIAAEDALDKLTEAFDENGRTLDVNTEKGRENKQALLDAAQAAAEAMQAKYEETGSVAAATATYDGYIGRLRDALVQQGLSREEAQRLIDTYAKMPPLIATTVTTPGLDTAIEKTRRLIELRRLLGSNAAAANAYNDYDYVSGRRWGGITLHARNGMLRDAGIYSPRTPARFAFAEPGTGGEAFIPKFGDYNRSMSTLGEAARWYGASVVPGGGGGTQTVVHEHRHTIEITGREMWSGFRRQIDRLGGNVQAAAGRKP